MSSWKDYVAKEHRQDFYDQFMKTALEKVDSLLSDACFFGNHHHYNKCQNNQRDELECCYGDSTDRDIKEDIANFYRNLWQDTFEALKLVPQIQESSEEEGEEEESEEEKSEQEESEQEESDQEVEKKQIIEKSSKRKFE